MKIIKLGKIDPPKKFIEVAECSKCHTEVEFYKSECRDISYCVGYKMSPYRFLNCYYIKCPHCGNHSFSGYTKEII